MGRLKFVNKFTLILTEQFLSHRNLLPALLPLLFSLLSLLPLTFYCQHGCQSLLLKTSVKSCHSSAQNPPVASHPTQRHFPKLTPWSCPSVLSYLCLHVTFSGRPVLIALFKNFPVLSCTLTPPSLLCVCMHHIYLLYLFSVSCRYYLGSRKAGSCICSLVYP